MFRKNLIEFSIGFTSYLYKYSKVYIPVSHNYKTLTRYYIVYVSITTLFII